MNTSSPDGQEKDKTSRHRENYEWNLWGMPYLGNCNLFSMAEVLSTRRQRMTMERAAFER